jgi:hypothetical protein
MTIRKEVIGDATLYCGSMEDVLPTLGKVDTVVMDPPYGISFSTNRGFSSWDRKQIESDQSVAARDIALLLCQPNSALVFGSWKMPKPLGVHTVLIWDKGVSGPSRIGSAPPFHRHMGKRGSLSPEREAGFAAF